MAKLEPACLRRAGLKCREAEMKKDECKWCSSPIKDQTSRRWHAYGNMCYACIRMLNDGIKEKNNK